MQTGRDFYKILDAAREHYENLKTDITNAKDRREHIRLTALAQEAHNLLVDLRAFEVGLVYSHTTSNTFYEPMHSEPLDLPEFKSPYAPGN